MVLLGGSIHSSIFSRVFVTLPSHNHFFRGKWVYLQYDRFLSFRVIFHWTMIMGEKGTLPETNIFAPKNGWLEY